jgi:hypothetical protein
MTFTHRELWKCAAREVAMRKNVFKKRGMTPEREKEIELMEAIAAHFRELAEGLSSPSRDNSTE